MVEEEERESLNFTGYGQLKTCAWNRMDIFVGSASRRVRKRFAGRVVVGVSNSW